jgi:hypothetical protein
MKSIKPETMGRISNNACVVYDPQTGRIFRIHQVTTMEGGRVLDRKEIETRALALTSKKGYSQMKVLHVEPDSIKPGTVQKVDLETLAS